MQGKAVVKKSKRTRGENMNKSKKSKERYSNFLITINTNQRVISDDDFEDFQDRFAQVLEELWNPDTVGVNEIIVLGKIRKVEGRFIFERDEEMQDNWKKHVISVDSESGIEESPNNKGMHSHTLLEVTHRAAVRVNREAIQEFISNHPLFPELSGKNIYINIALVRGAAKNILQYIRKNQDLTKEDLSTAFSQLSTE